MPQLPAAILDVKTKTIPAAPKLASALRLEKIAEASPADALGLQVGDYLIEVNGHAALNLDFSELYKTGKQIDYVFYQPDQQILMRVQTKALPLGLRMAPTSDAIARKYERQNFYGADDWFTLWERGDYTHLRRAAKACQKKSLLGKLIGSKGFAPADLMLAVCDIESGNHEQGYAGLSKFAQIMHEWTTNFHSLVYYYRAKMAAQQMDKGEARALIANALRANEGSDKIQSYANELGVRLFDDGSLVGRQVDLDFPVRYLSGGTGETSIRQVIAEMEKGQVLPLCLMAGYRGNGPYNADLGAYIGIYQHISERIHPMMMITTEAEKRKDRPHWHENENLALKRGIPFSIAFDADLRIVDIFRLRGAPTYHLINKSGMIIWSGSLGDDYAWWQALANIDAFD